MCEANSISVGTAPARRTMSPITAALFMLAVYAGESWIELQLQGSKKELLKVTTVQKLAVLLYLLWTA